MKLIFPGTQKMRHHGLGPARGRPSHHRQQVHRGIFVGRSHGQDIESRDWL